MVGSDTEATVMLNVVPGMNTGITAFNAGLSSINAQFQNITDTINTTFGIMDAMIVSSGVMIAQFGMGAANAFGEFEQGMQIVKAVSQQSGESIAYLKQEAQQFAIEYRTGIDSITEGLQTLGRAGLNSAQEQTEVLEQGLQTAKLEGRELNGVLEEIIQNTSLLGGDVRSDQFGEQAEYLNNLLVGTSLSAPLDTHDISETLKYSGGMVAAAGGTIATDEGYADEAGREIVEDYMGAVAAFAQKGVKGSIAGTALRAFFNKPASQDTSVVEALEQIGLAPEDLWNDEETMKPVSEQIEIIQTQMAAHNVSKMDQMQLWSKIVGGKMGQQMMKLDAQDIREMTTDIQDASSARDLADQTFNTYNQKMNKLNEESQKLFRDFGEHIVTAIRPALEVLDKLAEILNNPMFSGAATFAGFIGFLAILSHSLRAVLRIAQRVRQELSWLFGGHTKSIDAGNLLKNARTGHFERPYINLRRPSDISDYAKEGILSRKKPKIDSSDINEKVKSSTQNMKGHFESLSNSFAKTMKGVSSNISNAMNGVTKGIQENIKSIEGTISEVAETTIVKAKETADYIIAQNNIIKADMIDSASLGYSGQVGPRSDLVGITKDELNERTVPQLKEILMNQHGYSKAQIRKLGVKSNLVDEIHRLNNYDTSQIINSTAAMNDLDVADVYRNDPFFKGIVNPSGHSIKGEDTEDMRYLVNKREFGTPGGMFPVHMSSLPYDAQLYADIINSGHVDANALDEILGAQGDSKQKTLVLENIAKTVEFISKELSQQGVDEHGVNQRYYDEHTGMKDLDDQYKHAQKEFRDELGKNKMWSEINSVNKENLPMDKGLQSLFSDSTSARYRNKFWGGLTEEEFNKKHGRDNAPDWYVDLDDVNWAEESAWNKFGASNYIETSNANAGKLIVKRDTKGNFLGYGLESDYEITNRDKKGLSALFGEGDAPARHFQGYTKELSTREKIHSKLNKGADKVSEKFNGLAKSLGSTSTSTLGKAVDILGGPFSAAIMGATAAMEVYNYMFGQWQQKAQEHQTKLSEAQDSLSEAEGNIRQQYLENNPNASAEEADQAVEDAYLQIADSNYDMNALDENTKALYTATYQVQQATQTLQQDAMDGNFGLGGVFTRISDDLAGGLDLITGNYGTNLIMDTGEYASVFDNSGVSVSSGSITDNGNQAVLKGSQSSDDYLYSKENAAIFAADVWDAIDQKKDIYGSYGMGAYFGSDSAHFQEVNRSIFGGSTGFGNSYYSNVIQMLQDNFQNDTSQNQLQMFLKNNKQDAQKLAKDIRKFERANKGRSPISYFTDSKGGRVPTDKALKNLEVKDKDLVRYLKSLSIKTGMSAQQLLMASQLQQMQDLNQIMSEQLQPQVLGLAQNAYQQLAAQHGISGNTSNTSSGAWSTYNAAAAIATKLNVLVEQALDTEMQQDYIARGGQNQDWIENPQNMKAAMVEAYNTPPEQRTAQQKQLVEYYGRNWFDSYYLSGFDSGNPNATPEERAAALANYEKVSKGYDNFADLVTDTRKGTNDYYTKALVSAYDASDIGEGGSSPSSGSGGSGSGSGSDKDKDTGTKKERVDLVLCNKKEIPKLNVNLFKKAPSFTILNKNFKLRDIKINTQDKPKAVLDSIKNAIIDTQRRMDPKIIQDENAEYDPVAATDGNQMPSGSTSTTTD